MNNNNKPIRHTAVRINIRERRRGWASERISSRSAARPARDVQYVGDGFLINSIICLGYFYNFFSSILQFLYLVNCYFFCCLFYSFAEMALLSSTNVMVREGKKKLRKINETKGIKVFKQPYFTVKIQRRRLFRLQL